MNQGVRHHYVNFLDCRMKRLWVILFVIPLFAQNETLAIIDFESNGVSKSESKNIVSKIGNICISNFHKNRIATILKHIPGHGLAKVDSHKEIPIIHNNLKYLLNNDFYVFMNKKSLLAMTGHLLFKKLDKNNTVTHSKKIIKIIRKTIRFKNILVTDDLSMKALKYSIEDNTRKSFEAGCNLALHCNGNLNEMIIVAKNSPKVDKFILKKTSQFIDIIS